MNGEYYSSHDYIYDWAGAHSCKVRPPPTTPRSHARRIRLPLPPARLLTVALSVGPEPVLQARPAALDRQERLRFPPCFMCLQVLPPSVAAQQL